MTTVMLVQLLGKLKDDLQEFPNEGINQVWNSWHGVCYEKFWNHWWG
jgi:hypothetical protein